MALSSPPQALTSWYTRSESDLGDKYNKIQK